MNILKLSFLLICLALSACTNPKVIREEFEKSMKSYNRMLRWQEVETAGLKYMEPELRASFLRSAEEIRQKGVTITDYRILTTECTPEKSSAEVVAEFDYYILPSNRIKTLTYRQNWVYHEDQDIKGWKVKSSLPRFE